MTIKPDAKRTPSIIYASGGKYGSWNHVLVDADVEVKYMRHDEAMAEIDRLQAENTALRQQLAEARNKALDEACELVATITRDAMKDSDGVPPPDYFDEGTSAAYEAIRALKDDAP